MQLIYSRCACSFDEGCIDSVLARRLEERYAKNGRRRGLVYALRRRQSPTSFRSRWDCLCNEVDHTSLLADNLGMTLAWPQAYMGVPRSSPYCLLRQRCCAQDVHKRYLT